MLHVSMPLNTLISAHLTATTLYVVRLGQAKDDRELARRVTDKVLRDSLRRRALRYLNDARAAREVARKLSQSLTLKREVA